VALRYLQIEDTTGKTVRGPASVSASWTDEQFDVGVGGVTTVSLASTITGITKLDVYVNGVLRREGAGNTWVRNVTPARIDFAENIPQTAWVLVRVWS